jgi:nitrate reductase alpha subunit
MLARRGFLKVAGATAVTLGLVNLRLMGTEELPECRSWEDVYRQHWTWDRLVRGTQTMANRVSGCAWDLYVKDEVVWREEQLAPYRDLAQLV